MSLSLCKYMHHWKGNTHRRPCGTAVAGWMIWFEDFILQPSTLFQWCEVCQLLIVQAEETCLQGCPQSIFCHFSFLWDYITHQEQTCSSINTSFSMRFILSAPPLLYGSLAKIFSEHETAWAVWKLQFECAETEIKYSDFTWRKQKMQQFKNEYTQNISLMFLEPKMNPNSMTSNFDSIAKICFVLTS